MTALSAQRRHSEANLECVEQELCDFSYLVAHDLANEFRHVAEFSKLLTQGLGDTQMASYAEIITKSAARCQEMLRAIMAYSSVQTQPVLFRRWPARSIVERALVELGRKPDGATISIQVTGDVYGDARLIILAVRLSLDNAFRFRRHGVGLNVELRGMTDDAGGWRLEIADNGEGLEEKYRERAFGMFWRLDSQTSGIGSGLPMIRRIARRHEGGARFLDADQGARLELFIPGPREASS